MLQLPTKDKHWKLLRGTPLESFQVQVQIFCNNVAAILYLCFVGRKKTIFFKQLMAAFLLSVLSVVTIIQVSHSHGSISSSHGQKKDLVKRSILPSYNTATTESKCFICEYQLAKDVDANISLIAIVPIIPAPLVTEANYTFTFQRLSSPVETRGPPAIA